MTANWRDGAACLGDDRPDDWYATQGPGLARALAICAGCPVQENCLDLAMDLGDSLGVWGGLLPADRQDLGLVAADAARWADQAVADELSSRVRARQDWTVSLANVRGRGAQRSVTSSA